MPLKRIVNARKSSNGCAESWSKSAGTSSETKERLITRPDFRLHEDAGPSPLSDKYLRSPYCMTELYSVYQNARQERQEFLNRIIPLVLKDANIGNWRGRATYA
jgi:hypothetical protein